MRNNLAAGFAVLSITVFVVSLVVGTFGLALPFGFSASNLFIVGLVFMVLALLFRPRRSHR
ncbi:MAG TPA: hypothetical protein VF956_01740 [Candidatus Dormibacteraeota bacterium]